MRSIQLREDLTLLAYEKYVNYWHTKFLGRIADGVMMVQVKQHVEDALHRYFENADLIEVTVERNREASQFTVTLRNLEDNTIFDPLSD